jgi:hypothetical protein
MQQEVSRKIVKEFVQQELQTQVEFARKQFQLPADWSPELKISFDQRKKNSRAGRRGSKPFMELALASYLQPVNGFLEYEDYTTNMLIGSFKSHSWKLCLTALISHELAHAVQFTMPAALADAQPETGQQAMYYVLGKKGGDHGDLFRLIYKTLRKEFVNSQVDPYCLGVEPKPIPKPKHEMAGTVFHHTELGKCTITNYFPGARYPYEFMDVKGDLYKATKARMEETATFGFYNLK